jgi:hypothetical protein
MAILFLNDWQRYPQAIADLQTTNRSFVRLASLYREMGVRNHAFPLALHNPRLVGVDPHSKSITKENAAAVALECYENPWYWLREVVRAPALAGPDSVPIEANRSIISLYWLFYNHIMQILIQPRQTGKSFGTDSLMVNMMNISCESTKINLLTKDDSLRRKNITRIKEIMASLPRYLDFRDRTDSNNTEEITVNRRGNIYSSHVPQSSVKGAMNMGRGLTTPIFHIDEPPFQRNIHIALPAALPGMGAATDRAEANGSPYGLILTTTAGKKDDKEGRYIYNLLQEAAQWTEKFLDARDREHLYQLVRGSSRGGKLRVGCVYSHRQLGKTDDWLAKKLEEALQEGEDADRDYFNVWTSGSQTNPLPVKVLETITGSVRSPEFVEISPIGGYVTNWYIPEDSLEARMGRSHYIMSMDTSEASGNDDISIYLNDIETGETICVSVINETNLFKFAEWTANWFIRFKNFTAIIERRSTGAMLIDYLLIMLPQHGIDPFRRLFNTIVNDADDPNNAERYEEIKLPLNRRDPQSLVRYKKVFGYATSGSGEMSRDALYGVVLKEAAKRLGHRVYDKQLIDQIAGLIVKNGRIDHADGEHDDLVIGWLLANWLLTQGRNLRFYGINVDKIMSKVTVHQPKDERELAHMFQQQLLRLKIKELSEQMLQERDDFVSERMEQEMRALMAQLIFEDNEIFSVDDMVQRAREARRNRLRSKSTGVGAQPLYTQFQSTDQSGFVSRDRPLNAFGQNRWDWR